MAEHNTIGKIGEEIATNYLKSKDFNIIERNFHVKGGEIDIIATKNEKTLHVKSKNLCFVEVKTKKIHNLKEIEDLSFRPENNLTTKKKNRMKKAIKFYLSFRKIKESDININILAIIVFLNTDIKQAKIRIYEDFIL